jgi:hypothetical protein
LKRRPDFEAAASGRTLIDRQPLAAQAEMLIDRQPQAVQAETLRWPNQQIQHVFIPPIT